MVRYINTSIVSNILYLNTNETGSKHKPFLTRQVQHLLLSSIQCQYSQTIVVASTVTAKFSLLGCLLLLSLNAQNDWYLYRQRLLI